MFDDRYLDPTTDFGFKKLFGEEEIQPVLKSFLFDVLELSSPIVKLTYKRDRYAERETARILGTEEGREEGRKIGREIGQKEKAIQIAQALVAQNMPLETILQVTGLTREELQSLE